MEAKTDTLGISIQHIQMDWAPIRAWAERVFTKDRIADLIVVATIVTLLGAIVFSLYNAMQTSTYTGIGYTVFGGF